MSWAAEQLLAAALALPDSERRELAIALVTAAGPSAPELNGDAWLAELGRRSAEIDAGAVVLSPWDEVKQRARRLAWKSG